MKKIGIKVGDTVAELTGAYPGIRKYTDETPDDNQCIYSFGFDLCEVKFEIQDGTIVKIGVYQYWP